MTICGGDTTRLNEGLVWLETYNSKDKREIAKDGIRRKLATLQGGTDAPHQVPMDTPQEATKRQKAELATEKQEPPTMETDVEESETVSTSTTLPPGTKRLTLEEKQRVLELLDSGSSIDEEGNVESTLNPDDADKYRAALVNAMKETITKTYNECKKRVVVTY
jgi:hypothetical protein